MNQINNLYCKRAWIMENLTQSLENQLLSEHQQVLLASIRKQKTHPSLHKSGESKRGYSRSSNNNRFYQEALQQTTRKKALLVQSNENIKKLSNDKKISKKSTHILMSKLERTLNEQINAIDSQGTRTLSFLQLGQLFVSMDIFRNLGGQTELAFIDKQQSIEMRLHDLAWRILANDTDAETVDVRRVFCFLRILLDPEQIPIERQSSIIKEYLSKLESGPDQIGDFILQFCAEFREFNNNRLAHTKIGYVKPGFATELLKDIQRNLTFKPSINQVSQALQGTDQAPVLKPSQRQLVEIYNKSNSTSQFVGDASRIEQMMLRHERSKIKIQLKQQERETEEMQECSFQPTINPVNLNTSKSTIDRLYAFKSRQQIEEMERDAKIQRELDAMVGCTFQPQLLASQQISMPADVKCFQETVQRMRKAIDLNNLQKMKLAAVPRGENYEHIKQMPIAPPSMLSREKPVKETPALQIRVNMGGGRVGRLSLGLDDDPVLAVRNFVKIWGISREEANDLMNRVHDEMEKLQQEQEQD